MTESVACAEISFKEPMGQTKMTVGRTILDAIRAARLEVSNICARRGVCDMCRVVVSGSEKLSPVISLEHMSLTDRDIEQGFRIACCARISLGGPINIRIPPETLTDTQQLLVAGIQPKVKLNPVVTRVFETQH